MRILWTLGVAGLAIGLLLGVVVLIARVAGAIHVPGYAATVLVLLFFASLNPLGLGIIGSYVRRATRRSRAGPGQSFAMSWR